MMVAFMLNVRYNIYANQKFYKFPFLIPCPKKFHPYNRIDFGWNNDVSLLFRDVADMKRLADVRMLMTTLKATNLTYPSTTSSSTLVKHWILLYQVCVLNRWSDPITYCKIVIFVLSLHYWNICIYGVIYFKITSTDI